jgi:hypothetical protein
MLRRSSRFLEGTLCRLLTRVSNFFFTTCGRSSSLTVCATANEGDAVTVVQNFDSSQIQNALKHLQQASGSEPARPTSGTPIAVPMAGSHSSRPQQVARRSRQPAQPIRPGSYADVPPPLRQKPVSSNAVREGVSQPAPPPLSAEVLESHRSILSEKWLQTGQLKELEKTQGKGKLRYT